MEEKKVGSLIEAEKRTMEALQNFMFIIWTVNPPKNSVKCVLNDGTIKLWLNRDKFMKIMTDLLGPTTHELEYTLFRIKQSMSSYGVFYYYDRMKNEFKEIGFQVDFERISPSNLINETRKSMIQEKFADHFKEINKEYEEKTKDLVKPPPTMFNKFFKVIRKFTKKKNETI
jgi:hypothetical protein